jgi:hypothetical protein
MDNPSPTAPTVDPTVPHTRWRAWILPVAVALLAIAALLHDINADSFVTHLAWTTFSARCASAIITACIYAFPAVLAALLLIQNRRLRPLARLALLLSLLDIPAQIYYYFLRGDPTWSDFYALLDALKTSINLACVGCGIAALMLLPVLQPRHARLRTITLYAMFLLFLFDPIETLAYHFHADHLIDASLILQLVFAATLCALFPFVFYHILRNALPFLHRPPSTAAPAIELTCPRCRTAQTIPTNGGHCPNCHLRIYIALAEPR